MSIAISEIESGFRDFLNEGVLTSGEGARWVYRYNTIDGADIGPGDKYWDAHGDTLNYGVVAHEIYENTIY